MIKNILVKQCNTCGRRLPHDSGFCQFCGSNDLFETNISISVKKVCSKCGKTLPDDSVFCQYCGANEIIEQEVNVPLVKRCFDCGKTLPDDSVFCQFCGSKNIGYIEQDDEKNRYDNKSIGKEKDISSKPIARELNKERNFNKNHKFLIASLSVLLLVTSLILVLYYFDFGQKEIEFNTGQIINSYDLDIRDWSKGTPLVITAPQNKHAFVYVVFHSSQEIKYSSFMIKSKESYKFYLQNGTYKLYVAMGQKWQGKEKLFGKQTKYFYYNDLIVTAKLKNSPRIDLENDENFVKISKNEFPIK